MNECGVGSHTSQITQLTMYYTMEIDKQLKAYYIIIVTNTSSLFYLLSIQEILMKTTVELSTHFYMTMYVLVLVLCLHLFMSDKIHFIVYYYINTKITNEYSDIVIFV